MKLLLTSNGFVSSSLEKDFLELTGGKVGLRVAVIPTAGDAIEWVPDKTDPTVFTAKLIRDIDAKLGKEYLWYVEKGYDVVVADLKEEPKLLEEKLRRVDVIDVGGGDVNYLLDWAKKSRLDTYLRELLEEGVVYVGASAGSMLLQPEIGLTWLTPTDKADHIGLGVIDFIVAPHQKEDELEESMQGLVKRRTYLQSFMPFPWKIYLLQNGQAVKVFDGKVEHIGLGEKKCVMKRTGMLCFLRQGEKVLLIKVDYGNGMVVWNGVSGFVEEGEEVTSAVLREVKEEIGIDIDASSVTYKGNHVVSPELELEIFTATKWSGVPGSKEESIKDIQWYEIDNLPFSEMFPGNDEWIPVLLTK